jgi:hypothetical protein
MLANAVQLLANAVQIRGILLFLSESCSKTSVFEQLLGNAIH